MGEGNFEEFGAALAGRKALDKFLEKDGAPVLAADALALVEAWSSLLSPPDVAILTIDNAQFLIAYVRAGTEKSTEGWAEDDLAFTAPWGFELGQIRIPVRPMHGGQDQMAPFSHTQWLAGRIPSVQTRFLPDDGHLTVSFNRIPEVHAWLLGTIN
jgi:pimeloyl-ACP methyl ester carboxylesterase